jgi:TonB family protein
MTRFLITRAVLTLLLMSAPPLAHAQAHIVPDQRKAGDSDATQAPTNGDITAPTWLKLPTAAEFVAGMPDRARRLGRSGSAVMRCVVKYDGGLDRCVALSEAPAGLGFGGAAVKMAGAFKMAAQTNGGYPVAGLTITLTVEFPPP